MNDLIERELFENNLEFEDEYEWEDKQKGGFLSKLGKGKAAAVGAMMRILSLITHPPQEPVIPPKPVPTETRSRKIPASQGEFEWELEAELNSAYSREAEALMEYLGRAATEAQSEAEAAAYIGALLPVADRIISGTTPILMRNSPELVRGLVAATQALRRNPDTRPLVRTLPTIVRRTAASMNRQLQQGMPITSKTALKSLARQTQALLSSPQQSVQALKRSKTGLRHNAEQYSNSAREIENMSKPPRGRPSGGKDLVRMFHYSPVIIRDAVRPNQRWTDLSFGNRIVEDVARITGLPIDKIKYRYELILPRTEQNRIFRNVATKMTGSGTANEYINQISIPIDWIQRVTPMTR